ncbi:MAG: restriction endonuclease subunit S [Cyanobacteriota bacterium]
MKSIIRDLADIKAAKRWDFGFHDPEYLEVLASLDRTYPVVRFGDIITVLTDMGAFSLYKTEYFVDEGVPFLRVQNVQEYGVDLEKDTKFISYEYHQQLKKSQLQPGDLLLTTKAVIGVSAVVDENLGDCNISQNLVLIRLKEDINPNYVSVFLNSRLGRMQTETAATGPNQKYLNFERIYDLKITLPPRSLQDQIAQVMQEAYGDRQKKLLEAQQLLNSIDSFILEALDIKFDDLSHEKRFVLASKELTKNRFDVDFHLPETHDKYEALSQSRKCRVTSLGTLIEQIANGATPKGANYLNEGIPFFRIQNIVPDGLDLSDIAYISRQTHNEMKRSQTRPGDLLMTITGRVGTAAVIPDSIDEGNINQHIVIIRLKPGAVNTNYLATVINSSAVSFQANHRTTGTTRIALDYTAIKSLLIPVPTIEIQEQILGEVAHRRREAKRLRNEAEAIVTSAKARVERMILGEEIVE